MSTGQAVALAEMLKLVESHELARCRELMAGAHEKIGTLLGTAHQSARRRMHRHVQELKHYRDREIARVQAELATARRQQRQRRDGALLEAGWARLSAALLARWQETGTRQRWVDNLARQAFARLPHARWQAAHPANWPAVERAVLAEALTRALGAAPELIEDRNIAAGLQFRAGGACLDGTLEGLLVDRAVIEATLLAELDTEKN